MEFLFAAVLGAALGSFLGVIIDRSGYEVSQTSLFGKFAKLNGGRSHCSSCYHQLTWWENIPLLSYIFLRGRCRNCRSPIPYWLPLIETAGTLAGVVVVAMRPMSLIGLMSLMAIAAALIWIFFSDLVKGVVPDWAVVLGSVGTIAMSLMGRMSLMGLMTQIVIAAAAAGFFWLLVLVTRGRGMGAGDITLAFFLGLWLGWPKIAVAIWLAFLLGAAAAIGLIAARRKKFGQTVPFGPFLITAAIISYFYGEKVILWFL